MPRSARGRTAVRTWQRSRWEALSSTERLALYATYQLDQEREQAEHARWNRYERRLPADIWRWLPIGPGTSLTNSLAARGVDEAASGAAVAALAAGGLLLRRTVAGELGAAEEVRLTSLGRRVARVGDDAGLA